MLIAFSSIILGLSVTFFVYCQHSKSDGFLAAKVAQQRLSLHAALNYSMEQLLKAGTSVYGINFSDSLKNPGAIVDLEDPGDRRTLRQGWFRIALADQTYLAATPLLSPLVDGTGTNKKVCDEIENGVTKFSDALKIKTRPPTDPNYDKRVGIFITAGAGPSNGLKYPDSTNAFRWDDEMRAWYLAIFDFSDGVAPHPATLGNPYLVKLVRLKAKPDEAHW